MQKPPATIFLVVLAFFITLGLAVSLQSVFGIGIGSNLDFGGIRRIIGLPVPTVGSEAVNRDYVDSIASSGTPAGAVMFFNLASCPSGWTALAAAQGRYLVGLPSGGTLAETAGTALTNLENRPVGQHTHSISDPGHIHNYLRPSIPFGPDGFIGRNDFSEIWNGATVDGRSATGIVLNPSGTVAGTNAPYVQLLVCQKN